MNAMNLSGESPSPSPDWLNPNWLGNNRDRRISAPLSDVEIDFWTEIGLADVAVKLAEVFGRDDDSSL